MKKITLTLLVTLSLSWPAESSEHEMISNLDEIVTRSIDATRVDIIDTIKTDIIETTAL